MARFKASGKLAHLWLVPNPSHNPKGDFGLSAEGLALNDGEHLLLADEPEAFANAVVRLLRAPGQRSASPYASSHACAQSCGDSGTRDNSGARSGIREGQGRLAARGRGRERGRRRAAALLARHLCERRARFSASQVKEFVNTLRASSTRKPPLARCRAPGLIRVKSVTSAPNWATCSTLPIRLL